MSQSHVMVPLFGLIAVAVVAVAFVFWIWMLIDAIRNPRLDSTQKLIWVLVVLFLHWLGALIYFFVGREGNSSA